MAESADHPSGSARDATGWRGETLAVTAGRPARVPDSPLNHPITPASTYVAGGDVEYGRYGNAGWLGLEEAIGALEGGQALAFASGMAAAHAILSLVPRGGRLVLAENCYLGVTTAAQAMAQRGDLTLVMVQVDDTADILTQAGSADMVWLESPTNPLLGIADLAAVGVGMRGLPARLVVDSTFATPVLQQPLSLGADLVLHSATKFLSGHSDALLGAVVGTDPEVLAALETHRRVAGAVPGALEVFLVLRGLRTLHLRVGRSQESARLLAERLERHPKIDRVRYPGFGSIVSVELADAESADHLVGSTGLWLNATSLGGVESTFERRRRWSGESTEVPQGLVRMSVGLEHPDDLWQDLVTALG